MARVINNQSTHKLTNIIRFDDGARLEFRFKCYRDGADTHDHEETTKIYLDEGDDQGCEFMPDVHTEYANALKRHADEEQGTGPGLNEPPPGTFAFVTAIAEAAKKYEQEERERAERLKKLEKSNRLEKILINSFIVIGIVTMLSLLVRSIVP